MVTKDKYRFSELLIYSVLWSFVFTMPVVLSTAGTHIDFRRISHEFVRIVPFFILFIIHNTFVFRIFRKKQYTIYFISGFALIVFISLLGTFNFGLFRAFDVPPPHPQNGPMEPPPMLLDRFFYNFLISILVIGLNMAVKITFRWMESGRKYEELQKENFKTELEFLRHQISPHFFMNTLNNIHALIDYDSEIAKNSIIRLSKLMRVLLYESAKNTFTLRDEVNFLNDYIGLMRIRVNEKVDIKFEHPESMPDRNIPPLLFISFVENAFKHGINPLTESFIHIKFIPEASKLNVIVSNSKGARVETNIESEKIGLSNSRRRLDILFGDEYNLEVFENEYIFEVNIEIPLS
ncbi:MAG: hypothetical protein CVU11_12685 [Bacteroidetes bacterium HGW-Bacteroidetes-6]|nr:MAG: hypothetical protein CVU11_12685 [Bacteroidetes bacterium HGW-Bacteroidetes-6]